MSAEVLFDANQEAYKIFHSKDPAGDAFRFLCVTLDCGLIMQDEIDDVARMCGKSCSRAEVSVRIDQPSF